MLKMNKKGFTLVELLAVITLVAILSGIAVTNIVSTVNNSKKSTFLMDAKRMVSKAEYLLSLDKTNRNKLNNGQISDITYYYSDLNEKGEFQKDADDENFDSSTFVKITKSDSSYLYCVCVEGSRRIISNGSTCNSGASACVDSSTLTGIDKVKDKSLN